MFGATKLPIQLWDPSGWNDIYVRQLWSKKHPGKSLWTHARNYENYFATNINSKPYCNLGRICLVILAQKSRNWTASIYKDAPHAELCGFCWQLYCMQFQYWVRSRLLGKSQIEGNLSFLSTELSLNINSETFPAEISRKKARSNLLVLRQWRSEI